MSWRRRATSSESNWVSSVRQSPDFWPRCVCEAGDDAGVDRVCFGALAKRIGKAADLGRVDHGHRQASRRHRGRNHGLEAARRFHGDGDGRDDFEPAAKLRQAFGIALQCKRFQRRPDSHIEAVFGDIDANKKRSCQVFHLRPSLSKRARFAAQATVRVQWICDGGPMLSCGLFHPEDETVSPPPPRRTTYPSRQNASYKDEGL